MGCPSKNILKGIFFIGVFLCTFFSAYAQIDENTENTCEPKTIFEIFKKKKLDSIPKKSKDNFFLFIPIIGSQPATGFMYGAVTQYTFKGKGAADKYSIANLGVTYTEKKQLMINLKNNILLNGNKFFLSGDFRFYVFSQSNYGLGTNIVPSKKADENFDISSIEEPMNYNYLKFHQSASFALSKNFYAGLGVNIDWYSSVEDLNLDIENGQFTYHYNYNIKHNFDYLEYFINGVSLNLVYDSRDNQINSRKGWYANINYRVNPYVFSNQNYSNVLFAEYRHFVQVSRKNPNYVLGFWLYGQFITKGQVPYLNLPALGWDQRSRSGEGYKQGLYRGENLVYLSTEFRFPITCNQMLGATVFANFISTSSRAENVHLFEYIQPAAGVGLRLLIDKKSRTNLVIDNAWGTRSKGFYLNAGETF
ncbi:BamA/TamA family outer membrane protein [Flavobacterium sp. SE-1-e]|uniref:BamA/TamA family outer membrane protein n=1 Tax=Flavobacterium agrisoli TaxID=2793066 RepID=A0A934UII9_9FLAO|nr:BamA/TamA family outer membrane protein [Flavobacterium agrisoli]